MLTDKKNRIKEYYGNCVSKIPKTFQSLRKCGFENACSMEYRSMMESWLYRKILNGCTIRMKKTRFWQWFHCFGRAKRNCLVLAVAVLVPLVSLSPNAFLLHSQISIALTLMLMLMCVALQVVAILFFFSLSFFHFYLVLFVEQNLWHGSVCAVMCMYLLVYVS